LFKLPPSSILSLHTIIVIIIEHRVTLDILSAAKGTVLFTIDFCDRQLVLHLFRQLGPRRSKFLAMSTPRGKEFDEPTTILDLVGEASSIEFEDLAVWIWNACWCFLSRRRRLMCLCVSIRIDMFFEIFLEKIEFPGFLESFDEFAILVDVELRPPVDSQVPAFVLYES
jgi:hypothetical protein